ncbi:hypothetical protein [Pseudomonas sp. S2_C03]
MESQLETVALFSLKLAYESDGQSPILRDDLVMGDYQQDVFELLVKRGDVAGIQVKVGECVGLAMEAVGGVEKPLGRELQRLAAEVGCAGTMGELGVPVGALRQYLKDIL